MVLSWCCHGGIVFGPKFNFALMLPVNYMQVEGEDGPVLQLLYVSKAKKYSKLCNTAMCSVPSSREEVGAIFFFMNTSLGKQTSRQIWIT